MSSEEIEFGIKRESIYERQRKVEEEIENELVRD